MKPSARESDIRRRIRRWRERAADWWYTVRQRAGIAPPNVTAIRINVATFRRLTRGERIMLQAVDYGDLSDQSFLLDLLDAETRRADHVAVTPASAVHALQRVVHVLVPARSPTPATAFPVEPRPEPPATTQDAWNACVHQAEARASVAFAQGLARRDHVHDIRTAVLSAIAALERHGTAEPVTAAPPVIPPPAEPPPFHA